MYDPRYQNSIRLGTDIVTNKLEQSSKSLGMIYILTALLSLSVSIAFLTNPYLLLDLDLSNIFTLMAFLGIMYLILKILIFVNYFKLSNSLNDLYSILHFQYNFRYSSAKNAGSQIKLAIILEIVHDFLSPLLPFLFLFFRLFILLFISLVIIYFISWISIFLGFLNIGKAFKELSMLNLYPFDFINYLFFSKILEVSSVALGVIGFVKLIGDLLSLSYSYSSFILFLIAIILAFLSYILLVVGFFSLSGAASKIFTTSPHAVNPSPNFSNSGTSVINYTRPNNEKIAYSDDSVTISFNSGENSDSENNTRLQVKPVNFSRDYQNQALKNTSSLPTVNYCPNCGYKVEPDTRFCPNCGYKLF